MKRANSLIKPKAIKKGDTIGIVATGAPLEESRLQQGVKAIESRGYKVKIPLSPSKYYASDAWSNGSVEERLEALNDLVNDPEIRAIISARGGYGTPQILPFIEIGRLIKNPKVMVGLSDFCPMLVYQSFFAGIASLHASSVGSSLADELSTAEAKADTDELFEALSNSKFLPKHECLVIRERKAKGPILATNLSMLCFLLGTQFDIDLKGVILVLEDVGESPFRVHRMLLQLQLAGKLDGLAGLVFGRFSKCEAKHGPTIEEVFEIFVKENTNNYPVLKGLAMGHWGRNVPLPLGCQAEISGRDLKILESAVS